jgi:hypothetical protein
MESNRLSPSAGVTPDLLAHSPHSHGYSPIQWTGANNERGTSLERYNEDVLAQRSKSESRKHKNSVAFKDAPSSFTGKHGDGRPSVHFRDDYDRSTSGDERRHGRSNRKVGHHSGYRRSQERDEELLRGANERDLDFFDLNGELDNNRSKDSGEIEEIIAKGEIMNP